MIIGHFLLNPASGFLFPNPLDRNSNSIAGSYLANLAQGVDLTLRVQHYFLTGFHGFINGIDNLEIF